MRSTSGLRPARSAAQVRSGWPVSCRITFHRPGRGFGSLVLGAPALSFRDGAEDDAGVGDRVRPSVGPDESGCAVGKRDCCGHPVDFGCGDPGGEQRLSYDSGPVGLVLGEGLAGSLP